MDNYHSFVFKFVVKFLSLKDKAKCQLVCHQWKDIVDDQFRLYQFCLSSWNNDYGKQHQIYKHSPMTYIGPVIDKAICSKDYNKLDAILSRFLNLKCIYLDFLYNNKIHYKTFNYGFEESMLNFFKFKYPKLTHIYLHKAKKILSDHPFDPPDEDPNGFFLHDLILRDLIGDSTDYYIYTEVIQIKNTD